MGFIERIPDSLLAAQQRLKRLSESFLERDAASRLSFPFDARSFFEREGEPKTDAMPATNPKNFVWLAKIVAAADAQSARIIGLTSNRSGVGVTRVSHQLAVGLAAFGRKTLLVDASRADFGNSDDTVSSKPVAALLDLATAAGANLSFVDLATVPFVSSAPTDELRSMFKSANECGYTVVVDLPPVVQPSGQPTPAFAAAGSACEVCLLICLSGTMKTGELSSCVETSRIVGAKLAGLILNDWKLPAGRLLEG